MDIDILKIADNMTRKMLGIRHGMVVDVDYTGTAPWNPRGYIPSARVNLEDVQKMKSRACRVLTIGARANEGIWWPLVVGSIVTVAFAYGFNTPAIIGSFWSDDQSTPPGTLATHVRMKFGGHQMELDKETLGGVRITTADGKQVLLADGVVKVKHESGTSVNMASNGSMQVNIEGNETRTVDGDSTETIDGNQSADVSGNVSIDCEGLVTVDGKLKVSLKSETQITLETLKALSGIMTEITHPVCVLTGLPLGVSEDCEASA